MKDIILLGGGGHCKSVIDTIKELNEFNIVGILDIKDKIGTKIDNVEIIGIDKDLDYYYNKGIKLAFITVGSIGNTILRRNLYQKSISVGYKLPTLIDRTAIISKNIKVGQGTFVGKGAIINSNVSIGMHSIINTGVIIEHDCNIGEFCHIAPGSTLSGGVKIGNDTHIGTNTTIIQNINVGYNTLIGAGSVVIKNIGSNKKAYGNPCKEMSS